MLKAFTALAILKLRDEGKLSSDAPAENHVPEMEQWRYDRRSWLIYKLTGALRSIRIQGVGKIWTNREADRRNAFPIRLC